MKKIESASRALFRALVVSFSINNFTILNEGSFNPWIILLGVIVGICSEIKGISDAND